MAMPAANGLPLYRRIESDLRDRIQTGELQPGARLQTEHELMARYEVSRATVRQALTGLVAEGLVEIRRGRGTYVGRASAMEHRLGGFYSYSLEVERHGMKPGTLVRGVSVESAAERVAAALKVAIGSRVVVLERVRLADDEPIVTESSYLPAAMFPRLETIDFTGRRLYETLTSMYGVRPVRARETFRPILMDTDAAAVLDDEIGNAALQVDRVTFDADGVIIEYCRSILRADRYLYSVELGNV